MAPPSFNYYCTEAQDCCVPGVSRKPLSIIHAEMTHISTNGPIRRTVVRPCLPERWPHKRLEAFIWIEKYLAQAIPAMDSFSMASNLLG